MKSLDKLLDIKILEQLKFEILAGIAKSKIEFDVPKEEYSTQAAAWLAKLSAGLYTPLRKCTLRTNGVWELEKTPLFPFAFISWLKELPFDELTNVTFLLREHACEVPEHIQASEAVYFHLAGPIFAEVSGCRVLERGILLGANEPLHFPADDQVGVFLKIDGVLSQEFRARLSKVEQSPAAHGAQL